MCEICDGAKSTSEMPCSKVLTEFGKILYQVVGDGPAAQMAMQTTGGLHSPSEKGREVYGNLLYGIHLVLQRRITKYVVLPFVFGCQRAITVGSSHHVVRFKSFSKIALPEEPSL